MGALEDANAEEATPGADGPPRREPPKPVEVQPYDLDAIGARFVQVRQDGTQVALAVEESFWPDTLLLSSQQLLADGNGTGLGIVLDLEAVRVLRTLCDRLISTSGQRSAPVEPHDGARVLYRDVPSTDPTH